MFAHGLSIALLFGITGEIRKRVPSLDFDAMGGLAKAMPLAAFAFGLGAFAAGMHGALAAAAVAGVRIMLSWLGVGRSRPAERMTRTTKR